MPKGKQGTNMDKQEASAADNAEPTPRVAVKNEFAPNVIAGKVVEPAPSPEASLKPDPVEVVDEEASQLQEDAEKDFLDYFHGELRKYAEEFGYDIALKKRTAASGPVMLYHRDTREGKTFGAREEAGHDYMTGDELREVQEAERAAAE